MKVQPEVRATEGYPVVLPCTFSHPQHSQHSSLQVLWRLGHGQGSAVLYRCTSRAGAPTCEPGPQQDQRYRLEGNPRQHDLSLRINGASLQDSGRYYCRVEVQGKEHVSFEDKMGTRLRVEGKDQNRSRTGRSRPHRRSPASSCLCCSSSKDPGSVSRGHRAVWVPGSVSGPGGSAARRAVARPR